MGGGGVLRLCLSCGGVDEHRDCPIVASPRTPQEKVQRVQRALGEIDRTLFSLKMSKEAPTRTTLMTLVAEEGLLERFQAKDLADFGQKRAYNLIETALKERVREVQDALGDEGKVIAEQFPFARKAVELAYRLAGARLDSSSFDATPLASLAVHPVPMAANRGVSLSVICGEIDGRLEATRPLDAKVRGWGLKNLSALVTSKDPTDVPPELMGGGLGVLGAIVGRGPASRRASAVTQFKLLGDEFRERLYLLAANPILLRRASSVSQAEEAWRKHLAGEGTARWEAIRKSSADLLGFFLGPLPDLGARFDEAIGELAKKPRMQAPAGLVAFDKLAPEEWETLARAYFLIYDAVVADKGSQEGIVWEPIVRAFIERKPGGEIDRLARQKATTDVREAWQERLASAAPKDAKP